MELRKRRSATPQKNTRLQPKEPLHMRTRSASKSVSVNGSVSGAASAASGSSRRSSLNDQANNNRGTPIGGNDIDGPRYSKRRRVSNASKSTPSKSSQESQASSTNSRPSTRSLAGHLPPINETPVRHRRSKRLSDGTQENIFVAQPTSVKRSSAEIDEQSAQSPESRRSTRSSGRLSNKSSASGHSINSNGVLVSKETEVTEEELPPPNDADDSFEANTIDDLQRATPIAVSDAESEASQETLTNANAPPRRSQRLSGSSNGASESDKSESVANEVPEGMHLDNQEDVAMASSPEKDELPVPVQIITTAPTEDNTTSATPVLASGQASPSQSLVDEELEPKLSPGSAPEESAGITEADKPVKKMPGRRRAPHPNPKVEAALRRQLHLRMAYRAIAKQLKPLLAELSKRTVNQLELESDAHEKAREYEQVQLALDSQLEQRLQWIQRQHDLNRQKLTDTLEEESALRQTQYFEQVERVKDDMVVQLQHKFITAVRKHQTENDDQASEDEGDDVIPALHHVSAHKKRISLLDPIYHARSRPAIETQRIFDEMLARKVAQKEQRGFAAATVANPAESFTTMDPTNREAATAHRKIKALIQAIEKAQKRPATPPPLPISNDQAHGLQLLAMASTTNAAASASVPDVKATEVNQPLTVSKEVRRPSAIDTTRERARTHSFTQSSQPFHAWAPQSRSAGFSQIRWPPAFGDPYQQQLLPQEQRSRAPSVNGLTQSTANPTPQQQQSDTPLVSIKSSTSPPNRLPPSNLAPLLAPSHSSMANTRSSQEVPAAQPAPRSSKDFWSSLATTSQETISAQPAVAGTVKIAPRNSGHPPSPLRRSSASSQGTTKDDSRPSQPSGFGTRERTDMRPPSNPPAQSNSSLGDASRIRSASDSFGPLLNPTHRTEPAQDKKPPAPKQSMWGPWPRSRNYDPFRRASLETSATSQSNATDSATRGFSSFRPADSGASSFDGRRPQPFAGPWRPQGGRTSVSTPAGPPPIISRTPVPPSLTPYSFGQRGYQQAQTGGYGFPPPPPYQPGTSSAGHYTPHSAASYAPPPPGYAAPPLGSYQGVPPPPPPATVSAPNGLHQYGGPTLLPAQSHAHPPYPASGGNASGTGTTAPPAQSSPAFAQYQQQGDKRRRNQSFGGHDRFQHYQGPR